MRKQDRNEFVKFCPFPTCEITIDKKQMICLPPRQAGKFQIRGNIIRGQRFFYRKGRAKFIAKYAKLT